MRSGVRQAFLIKWNPRRAPVETIAATKVAHTDTQWVIHRPGKRECVWQEALQLADVGSEANPARRVYRLTERTIDKHGVVLLLPEYVLEGWTTTLAGVAACEISNRRRHTSQKSRQVGLLGVAGGLDR